MRSFALKFKPFPNAYMDDMKIEAETLLKAADQFKIVFPKGKILEIQPEEYAGYDTGVVVYDAFVKQPNRKAEGEPEGELIHVDFKLKVRIT